MKKKPSISFFCPAYNDEENLPILIPKTVKLLEEVCSSYEIVIIEDASPDKTGKVADALSKRYSKVKVVHHKKNKNYGGALKSGFKNATKYPYVFYTDGDNQYDVSVLKKMLKYIGSYDAVVGHRIKREINMRRKVQSSIYNGLLRLFFNLRSTDANCAIRLFKREWINKIQFRSKSAFLPAETLIALTKKGAKIKEIDVRHYPRTYGEASGGKISVVLSTFWEMIRYFLNSPKS